MTAQRNWQLVPPEQAVVELVEKLTALETRHRDALMIVQAAKREVSARKAFDMANNQKAFEYLTETRDAFVVLVEAWPL